MEGERRVLQHRVQPLPVERRRVETGEGIRGDDDEEEEGHADRALYGEHIGLKLPRQVGAEGRDRGAEQRQDQHPQHHGAFVVPPQARDLVEERLRRVGVAPDILDREVRGNIGRHQRDEGDGDQDELELRGGSCDRHKLWIAHAGADQRQHHLHDGDAKGEDQRVVTGLGNHLLSRSASAQFTLPGASGVPACASPRHKPCSFSFLATSGGMYFSSCLASTLSA